MCVCVCVCVCAITAVKNYEQKNTTTSGKLIKAVYASYGYVYIFCASWSGRLFVGLGGWGSLIILTHVIRKIKMEDGTGDACGSIRKEIHGWFW